MSISPDSRTPYVNPNNDISIHINNPQPAVQTEKYGASEKILSFFKNIEKFLLTHLIANFISQKTINALTAFVAAIKNNFKEDSTHNTTSESSRRNNFSGNKSLHERHIQTTAKDSGKIGGFPNLGNTCYANSSLKFLIHSVGKSALTQHLEEFKQISTDVNAIDAANHFIQLISVCSLPPGSPPSPEKALKALFSSLQKTPEFNETSNGKLQFNIVGDQQDPDDFLATLSSLFNLSTLGNLPIDQGSLAKVLKYPSAFWTPIYPKENDKTLQDTITSNLNNHLKFSDLENTKNFSVSIIANNAQISFDFNQSIQLSAKNEKGEPVILTLKPTEVISFSGKDASGHYRTYKKESSGGWTEHNDSNVTSYKGAPQKNNSIRETPKFINFSVARQK